ncbi:hypothetical protein Q3G72_012508 [Acer saccharum]|nr:hypothetical protein Q3G72_012508 [Acer saccharum]
MVASGRNPQRASTTGGNWRSNQYPNLPMHGEGNSEYKYQIGRQEVTTRGRELGDSGKVESEPKNYEPRNENNIDGINTETAKVIMVETSELPIAELGRKRGALAIADQDGRWKKAKIVIHTETPSNRVVEEIEGNVENLKTTQNFESSLVGQEGNNGSIEDAADSVTYSKGSSVVDYSSNLSLSVGWSSPANREQ